MDLYVSAINIRTEQISYCIIILCASAWLHCLLDTQDVCNNTAISVYNCIMLANQFLIQIDIFTIGNFVDRMCLDQLLFNFKCML